MPTSRPINGTARLGRRRRAGQGLLRPEPGAASAGPSRQRAAVVRDHGAALAVRQRHEPARLPGRAVYVRGLRLGVPDPVRKVYDNISITGLSVAVAFLVGTIEL